VAEEFDAGAALDDRLSLAEEHDFNVVAVTHSQLLGSHNELAVVTVSYECR